MPTILDEILAHKKLEVSLLKEKGLGARQLEKMQPPPLRDFLGALKKNNINIIAEIKKASPSKGVIREDFDALEIARVYEENGASAISVLTDERFFMGSVDVFAAVKRRVGIPILRKDFIIDPKQVYESRMMGADAILLIVAILDRILLKELFTLAASLGMDSLVEVHTEAELDAAMSMGAGIIGINNRDLNTFSTDISTTIRLMKNVPKDKIVVSESGISSFDDIQRLMKSGVGAFLVGEVLMKEKDIGRKLRELRGKSRLNV